MLTSNFTLLIEMKLGLIRVSIWKFCVVGKLSDEIRSVSVPGFRLYVTGH